MKFYKAFKHALNMVIHAKLRSWLTILGIVIGVAAVISIVSIGDALEADLNSQFDGLGGDLLTLTAGAPKASSSMGGGGGKFSPPASSASEEEVVIDKRDVQILKGISDIKLIDTRISDRADIYYVAEKGTVTINGVDPLTWSQITTLELSDGRVLGPADSNVIVIGGKVADGFFDKDLGVNQLLTIEEKLFRIVGILDDESTSIYMPIKSAYEILEDKDIDVYDSVIIQVKDEEQIESVISIIEQKLMIFRHVNEKTVDFSVSSNLEAQSSRAEMMASLTAFLAAIAAVALLVGAVGITNTMFTSVLEKTKEIGIMKAIGARNNDILRIFLINAALIGFIGGVIGIIVGILLSSALPAMMGTSGIMGKMGSSGALISLQSILWSIGLSVLLAMIAGAIPAYKGSKLKPVDALRYE